MPQARTEVALQFSECCAAETALQHWLFCCAEVICPGRNCIRPPPPSSPFWPEGIFEGGGGGCIFRTPPRQDFYTPPLFYTPPTPRRVFLGAGGGCIKFGPVIWTKSCAAANEKLHCNIEKAALQESGAFLQRFPAGFKTPRLGTRVSDLLKIDYFSTILTLFRLRFGLLGPRGREGPGTHFEIRTLFATFGPKGPSDRCSGQKFS